jgi:hypothetical protein
MQDINKVGNLLKKCALPESGYGIFVSAVGFARVSFVVRSRVGARLKIALETTPTTSSFSLIAEDKTHERSCFEVFQPSYRLGTSGNRARCFGRPEFCQACGRFSVEVGHFCGLQLYRAPRLH